MSCLGEYTLEERSIEYVVKSGRQTYKVKMQNFPKDDCQYFTANDNGTPLICKHLIWIHIFEHQLPEDTWNMIEEAMRLAHITEQDWLDEDWQEHDEL
jgi:hypothetical protein